MFCVSLLEEKLYFIRCYSFINLWCTFRFFFELFVSSFFILFHPFSSKKAEKGRKRQKKAEKGREGTPGLKKDGYNIFALYHSKRFIKYKIVLLQQIEENYRRVFYCFVDLLLCIHSFLKI